MKTIQNALLTATVFVGLAAPAFGQVKFNEILIDAPGTDNGLEFIELFSSAPSFSMSGLWLLGIEGDGAGAGVLDVALNLGSFSTGANGLFLWRDSATVLSPAPHPLTTVNVADFNPDLENGSTTYLLVSGFTGSIGTDYDAGNDGVLDSMPWTSVIDAIGILENDGAANIGYGASLGFLNLPQFVAFNPDAVFRVTDGGSWYASDVNGTSPGPFTLDALEQGNPSGASDGYTGTLTPGGTNVVPEPSTIAMAGLGFSILCLRNRKLRR